MTDTPKPATPLPWKLEWPTDEHQPWIVEGPTPDKWRCIGIVTCDFENENQEPYDVKPADCDRNARYIVHACNSYPELSAEVERLTVERDTAVGERIAYANKVLHLEADLAKRDEQYTQQLHSADIAAHVIIEAGVVPGVNTACRCEACREVAQRMDEAGYLQRVEDRWWEEQKDAE